MSKSGLEIILPKNFQADQKAKIFDQRISLDHKTKTTSFLL